MTLSPSRTRRIAFVDPVGWDYGLQTPLHAPMGGSQAAICYLLNELSKTKDASLQFYLFNGSRGRQRQNNVICLHLNELPMVAQHCDVLVLSNAPAYAPELRRIAPHSRIWLWTGHSYDQPAVQCLSSPPVRTAIDRLIFVSDWQKRKYQEMVGLSGEVIRNGVPEFFKCENEGKLPVVIYTSTPFRGLDKYLEIWPLIHSVRADAELWVYSSMAVYRQNEIDRNFEGIFTGLRKMPGVKLFGSVGQIELSRALKKAAVFGYPNAWEETSCIALLEGMKAGCRVITTDLGALPESSHGFAQIVSEPGTKDFSARFAHACIGALSSPMDANQIAWTDQTHNYRSLAHIWLRQFSTIGGDQ